VHGVAEVLLERGNGIRHVRRVGPGIHRRNRHILGIHPVAADAEDLSVLTEVAFAGAAVRTSVAHNMGFD
jgi:hypothetical protein